MANSHTTVKVSTDKEESLKQAKAQNSNSDTREKSEPQEFDKRRIAIVLTALCVAVFMSSLDGTIVATALPTIANKFNANSSISWLITANFLAQTCFQPLYGKFSDIFGRKEMLLTAITVFEIGSLASGLVNSIHGLILSRALAGMGSGGIAVLVQVVTSEMVPIQERGKYLSFLGIAFGLASVVGPLLGGVFTDKLSYRWCFFINLPVGIFASTVIFFLVKTAKPVGSTKEKIKRIDFIGAILLVIGLVMLLLALNFGGKRFPWDSTAVLCLLVFGLVFLSAFAYFEINRAKEPILPLKLFKQRNVWTIVVAQFFMGFGLYGLIYYIPLYDTVIHNASASKSGVYLLPFIVGMVVFSLIAGFVISKTGKYKFIFRTGVFLMTVGAGLNALLKQDTSRALAVFYLLICGVGYGLCMQAFIVCIQATTPKESIAGATSSVVFARVISGAVGIAMIAVVNKTTMTPKLDSLIQKYPELADQIKDCIDDTSLIYNYGFGEELKNSIINAFLLGFRSVFIFLCAIMFVSFIFTLLTQDINFSVEIKSEDTGSSGGISKSDNETAERV